MPGGIPRHTASTSPSRSLRARLLACLPSCGAKKCDGDPPRVLFSGQRTPEMDSDTLANVELAVTRNIHELFPLDFDGSRWALGMNEDRSFCVSALADIQTPGSEAPKAEAFSAAAAATVFGEKDKKGRKKKKFHLPDLANLILE